MDQNFLQKMSANRCCVFSSVRNNFIKAESNGWRSTFFFPGGGTYKGHWTNSKHDWYGVKTNKNGLTYDGQWKDGKRHGYGTMRQLHPNGITKRIYVGQWHDDMKWGEGKHFYPNGTYYGWWKKNRRHGLGIKWYKTGQIYMGEWEADVRHGLGLELYENGNRYEGHFARGFKNGEGTFYHVHTGQVQKGVWEDDICKASLMQDELRQTANEPTAYPIPKCELAEPDEFVRLLFQKYLENGYKPTKSFNELNCLRFLSKWRRYAKFESKAISDSKVKLFDLHFPCICKRNEPLVRLREL